MSQHKCPPPLTRQKPPLDGFGPRGDPQSYYTSRVNLATARYARFVKKLRAEEEEQRKGALNLKKELTDKKNSKFFIRCDRRSNINRVARRVDLCLKSYEEDLEKKRHKLREILDAEEKDDIRKFVVQAQAGSEQLWQDKVDRLQYLLDKRKRELENKYKDTPLSKCTHISTCLTDYRCKESKVYQKYQMHENQARKMQEREFDKMWHEVNMKECEAMSARMEIEAIERKRRDYEWKLFNENECERKQKEKERMKELQKKEDEYFQGIWDEENRMEREKQLMAKNKDLEAERERQEANAQSEEIKKQKDEDERITNETWEMYAKQGMEVEKEKQERRRQKDRDQVVCNRSILDLQQKAGARHSEHDHLIEEVHQQQQLAMDLKRCERAKVAQSTHAALMEQIQYRERVRQEDRKKEEEELAYNKELFNQIEELEKYKAYTDLQTRKQHQQDLLDQIAYNKLLKERQKQEERDQFEKAKQVDKEYVNTMAEMMGRPVYSDLVHPFQKMMMNKVYPKTFTCPCKKPNWCKD